MRSLAGVAGFQDGVDDFYLGGSVGSTVGVGAVGAGCATGGGGCRFGTHAFGI